MEKLDEIRQLEEQLLRAEVRRSELRVTELLAPTFVEFGASGKVWNRNQIVQNLQQEEPASRELDDFKIQALAPEVVLTTYRVRRFSEAGDLAAASLRSSIWVHRDGHWHMLFHQGTPQRIPM
jgi:hypothetical protein